VLQSPSNVRSTFIDMHRVFRACLGVIIREGTTTDPSTNHSDVKGAACVDTNGKDEQEFHCFLPAEPKLPDPVGREQVDGA